MSTVHKKSAGSWRTANNPTNSLVKAVCTYSSVQNTCLYFVIVSPIQKLWLIDKKIFAIDNVLRTHQCVNVRATQ